MVTVSSWGRLGKFEHDVRPLTNNVPVAPLLKSHTPGLAYGMGRSYGDICLNPDGILWPTSQLDRLIAFDEKSGRLICQAGMQLKAIQQIMMPRGWGLPVTPGTQFVTVGGAIANDVHGKNHHKVGSFGDHVLSLTLIRTDGSIRKCEPGGDEQWFKATIGGMGLTGVIVEAEIQMCRVAGPWMQTETVAYGSLDEFFELADQSEAGWEHTVSWIDCLSPRNIRGIFMRANACALSKPEPRKKMRSIPFTPPVSLVNKLSLRPFNALYYAMKKAQAEADVMHYTAFSYPLDNLLHWNRIYGPRGFYQYQSVVPRAGGQQATQAMLDAIADAGEGSFLAVLKTFGERDAAGMMSFPRPGVTLALDFPNKGASTLRLFERLDAIVHEAGGTLYPAKDARMPRALFEAGYPRLQEFSFYRDPGISSAMSRRLMGK